MRVCIHRGARQIGGTCVEIESEGARLLLDLGLPLEADGADPGTLLPPVDGLRDHDPSLLAVILSHGHRDHSGLLPHVRPEIRLVAGAATLSIMEAAAAFVPGGLLTALVKRPTKALTDRRMIEIGPFSITPFLVDHSAFDAYALLIESGGRRLFYTGDLRGHGRKAALFERLTAHPPPSIHAMLMEGSSLGRLDADKRFPAEADVEAALVERFRPDGFVGVCASAQNIDRVVSIYRACKRTQRTLLLDLYAMEVLRATGNPNVPGPGWPNLAVYVPEYQRRHIARTRRFDIVERYQTCRVFREAMCDKMPRSAILFRPAMMADIDLMPGVWEGARMIWSQWDGYLHTPSNLEFADRLARRNVPLEVVHTSGHASIPDLKRLAQAFAPDALVPIHTFHGDRFRGLFGGSVRTRDDGEWWEV